MIRVAAAAYPLDWFEDWDGYAAKMESWVGEAAGTGAQILLFPEYGAMELVSLGNGDGRDLALATESVIALMPRATEVLSGLAVKHGVHIVAPSGPVRDGDRVVNRAFLLSPTGGVDHQDKLMMTPWEREPWWITGNGPLKVFDTALGRLAILICYDCEFPLLARQAVEAGADLILIPSATETVAGYNRVKIGAMARALEGQCFTVMSSITGPYPVDVVDVSHGAGGVFCPPDKGLPPDGVIAVGALDVAGWTYGDLDPGLLAAVRTGGGTRNRDHWPEQVSYTVTREELT
ncbi:amidohydrolase [Primorskyibacter flagellatus]|uniref:Amidohydrolase n=1 Tax=Primorskyibacter flagellatus TaxID=1387277 RepID=A0A917EGI3_9RHOB|nr:carbon-nitrogen hydrolase family protein [Primorskyibacter flagellatus]GGE32941.1 amidohydrolase [Primorskyibacter flagellatus]